MRGILRSPCSPLCHAFHNHSLYFHIPILAILGFFILMYTHYPGEFYASDYFRYFIYVFTGFGVVGIVFYVSCVLLGGEVAAPVALSSPSARRVSTKQQRNRVRPLSALERLAFHIRPYRHLFEAYLFSAKVILVMYMLESHWAPIAIGINHAEQNMRHQVMMVYAVFIFISLYTYWYLILDLVLDLKEEVAQQPPRRSERTKKK